MARGEKADRTAIIERLEHQSVRVVATEFKVAVQTVYSILRNHRGICTHCNKPTATGRLSCDKCLEKERIKAKTLRQERSRAGVCVICEQPKAPTSSQYCDAHRIIALENRRKHLKRKSLSRQRGYPNDKSATIEEKLKRLKKNYGNTALDCFKEANGSCEICAVSWKEVSIHVHHVDCDEENHERTNLICLCFDCHRAVHQLMRIRNRGALLLWFEDTYPGKPLFE